MRKLTSLFFVVSISMTTIFSQESEIKKTIHTFFNGLEKGDTIILKQAIHKDLSLRTIFVSNDTCTKVKSISKNEFLKAISLKKERDVWKEKLLSFEINSDANLAIVWTQYEFYLNSKFSHSGVNSFQLINNNGSWEIFSIVDTRKKMH